MGDLDLGPNGKILQYVDDLLICSPDEKSAQRHAIQVLNFLAERGHKVGMLFLGLATSRQPPELRPVLL